MPTDHVRFVRPMSDTPALDRAVRAIVQTQAEPDSAQHFGTHGGREFIYMPTTDGGYSIIEFHRTDTQSGFGFGPVSEVDQRMLFTELADRAEMVAVRKPAPN